MKKVISIFALLLLLCAALGAQINPRTPYFGTGAALMPQAAANPAPRATVPDSSQNAAINALASIKTPNILAVGIAYNQFAGLNAFGSAIFPLSSILPALQSTTMYESTTADVFPMKATLNGKPGYLLTTSIREGMHRVMINTPNFMGLIGADVGYAFAQGAATGMSTSGISAAFTITGVWKVTKNLSVIMPVRALYMANLGGWNPIAEFGLAYTPGGK